MPSPLLPNQPGHVDPKTGRMAITLEDALQRDDPDLPFYLFDAEAHALGIDSWRLGDGLDPHVKEPRVDVWLDSGSMLTKWRTDCVYIGKREACARVCKKAEESTEDLQTALNMLTVAGRDAAAALTTLKALIESTRK